MKLLPHQETAVDWLLAQRDGRAYLGDAPGFGKTFTIASAVAKIGDMRPLVVCPAIVVDHWRQTMNTAGVHAPWVLSYEKFLSISKTGSPDKNPPSPYRTVVLDEAHYAKHASAGRTLALLGKDGPVRRADHVLLASGTPVPRSPDEFATVFLSCFPHLARRFGIPTVAAFREKFVVTRMRKVRHDQWAPKVVGIQNSGLFQEILNACMLRRTVMEGAPALFWQHVPLSVENAAEAILEGAELPSHLLALAEIVRNSGKEGGHSLWTDADILKDPHVARWRRKVGELKAPAVVEMLKQQLLDGREKVVVFAYHHSVLDIIQQGLGTHTKTGGGVSGTRWVGRIDGKTTDAKRDEAKEWFANVPGPAVLLAQNTAVGTGTDGLQAASNRCVLVEPSWAGHENDQMAKRLARIGGSKTVTAQMVSLAGTLDDYIVAQNTREAEWHTRIFGENL